MLLRNWYNLLTLAVLYCQTQVGSDFKDGCLNYKSTSGTNRAWSGVHGQYVYETLALNNLNLVFGTGTSDVTFDDYNLESKVSIYVSNQAIRTPTYDANTKKWSCARFVNLTNNTGNDVTITEVGLMRTYKYSGNSADYALVYREKLAEPFTIKAGETIAYNHVVEVQYPTF